MLAAGGCADAAAAAAAQRQAFAREARSSCSAGVSRPASRGSPRPGQQETANGTGAKNAERGRGQGSRPKARGHLAAGLFCRRPKRATSRSV